MTSLKTPVRVATAIPVLVLAVACSGRSTNIDTPIFVLDGAVAPVEASVVDRRQSFPDLGVATSLVVDRVVPDHGPYSGGTEITLRGAGFEAGMTVTVGGLLVQPADIRIRDPRRAVVLATPAGRPGPADVVVRLMSGEEFVARGAFTYDMFSVTPGRGATAGGTVITLTGMGTRFTTGDRVMLGTLECAEITVVSASAITCRTPAMPASTVDVRVISGRDSTETTAVGAFTFYEASDPLSGGLGGRPIEEARAVNVSLFDSQSGAAVEGACVIVSPTSGVTSGNVFSGATNSEGTVTISNADLAGPVNVTIARDCYEKVTFVNVNVSDITAFADPWMLPRCGDGGEPPPPGPGRRAAILSGELVWPTDMMRVRWTNVPEPRNADWVKVAYVHTTTDTQLRQNPDPGAAMATGFISRVVDTSGTNPRAGFPFRIVARPAALAVYAIAGLEHTRTKEFVPYSMGVARGILVGPGEEKTDIQIQMTIPLDHTVDVTVRSSLAPARGGPEYFSSRALVDLGGEGAIVRILGEPLAFFDVATSRGSDRPLRFFAQPALSGTLADARYRVITGWYTNGRVPPFTEIVQRGILPTRDPVVVDSLLGLPRVVAPVYGEQLDSSRTLRWVSDGSAPDFHYITINGGNGMPAWTFITPGDARSVQLWDTSTMVAGMTCNAPDVAPGELNLQIRSSRVPGFMYDSFTYEHVASNVWSHMAVSTSIAGLVLP